MGIINYLKGMMADGTGNASSKRWIAMIAMILVSIGFLANLFWSYTPAEFIFNAVMYIVLGSLGITGVEKFSPKSPSTPEE